MKDFVRNWTRSFFCTMKAKHSEVLYGFYDFMASHNFSFYCILSFARCSRWRRNTVASFIVTSPSWLALLGYFYIFTIHPLLHSMKFYYTYVLFSEKDHQFYIGYSTDVKKRFDQHNSGLTKSTAPRRPFRLIYYEAHLN